MTRIWKTSNSEQKQIKMKKAFTILRRTSLLKNKRDSDKINSRKDMKNLSYRRGVGKFKMNIEIK